MSEFDLTGEEWRPVVGYEDSYEVSNKGRVRSIDRFAEFKDGRKPRFYKSQILKQKFTSHYYRVGLSKAGKTDVWTIHHLVCEAFHGPRPVGNVVRHLNGDYKDNRADNLCWGTHAENTADMMRHGTHYWANLTHCIHGHEFTEANTRVVIRDNGGQQRNCRACERIRSRPENARRSRARAAARPFHSCEVCSASFQTAYRQKRFCSPECKKASRRVAFKQRGIAA